MPELNAQPQRKAQNNANEHLIGIKYGYSLSGVIFDPPTLGGKFASAPVNISLLYTYYHSMWGQMPYFGIQTGLKYGQEAVKLELEKENEDDKPKYRTERYTTLELPMISQFRLNFWKMRFLVNLGCYGGYRLTIDREGGFDKYDKRIDYGLIGGAGIALVFKPVEIHLEGNYKYGFGDYYAKNKYSEDRWTYSNASTIMISLGFYIHLEKNRKRL